MSCKQITDAHKFLTKFDYIISFVHENEEALFISYTKVNLLTTLL